MWKICLVSDFSGPTDEGMKKVAYYLAALLSENHEVLPINVKRLFLQSLERRVKEFKPDIVFYVGGPTPLSFIILRAIAAYYSMNNAGKSPKKVLFALHPVIPCSILERLCTFFKPDLILVQSCASERMFKKLGMNTAFLPVGVDLHKFTPVTSSFKKSLRQKYGLPESSFIVLHVGSVRSNRDLKILTRVSGDEGICVLIVASTSMPMDADIAAKLGKSGCVVWRRYFPNIEEVYQLSDLYVFPVVNEYGSIEFPLSVIEAMACNLPVVSTRFGALPRILNEGNGLIFVDNIEEIPLKIRQIKNQRLHVKTRNKVLHLSWGNIHNMLVQNLQNLLRGE